MGAIATRDEANAARFIELVPGAHAAPSISAVTDDVDLIFVTVPDDAIAAALHHCREFQRAKEEVFNENTADRIHKLQIGFKVQKAEQDAEMARFRDGELDVLVGTTVVEVGVDVPNATLMVIENPERMALEV